MKSAWWKSADDLVDEQVNVLALAKKKNFRIIGPPGSGKTNLLLLRANYFALNGMPNIQIIVFTSLLKRFIATGGNQYKFDTSLINTQKQFFLSVLRAECSLKPEKIEKFEEERRYLAELLLGEIEAGRVGKLYQAILLDEAQDYLPEEIKIFSALADVIVATADFRQKIYSSESPQAELEAACPDVVSLQLHFRNGKKICVVADGVMKGKPEHIPMLDDSNYNETAFPSTVQEHLAATFDGQIEKLLERLAIHLKTYPEELIGVLCPEVALSTRVWEALQMSPMAKYSSRNSEADFDPEKPIWISTVASAKGLEFRCVHLLGAETLTHNPAQRKLTFTAVTRAKTVLEVYRSAGLAKYFESALSAVSKAASPVSINKLFGS
jgi:superfamily I DNA/RNA helicase